jgi:hypothetical protein
LVRSIIIELKSIEPENRINEVKMDAKFSELRPKLLGYILNIIAKAMAIKDSVELELKYLPRMGDFAIWSESIARVMGYEKMKFMSIYDDNIARQNVETIENNLIGQCISRFINNGKVISDGYWCGYTSDFLKELNVIASKHNIDTNSKYWPKSANGFTRKLKTITTNIRDGLGYDIFVGRDTSGKNRGASFMEIRKVSSLSSLSSPQESPLKNDPETVKTVIQKTKIWAPLTQIRMIWAPLAQVKILWAVRKYLHLLTPKIVLRIKKVKVVKVVKVFTEPHRRMKQKKMKATRRRRMRIRAKKIAAATPKPPSHTSHTSHSNCIYADLIVSQYLDSVKRTAYRCKEHPDSPWYYDLKGIEVSHFEAFHDHNAASH